MKVYVIITLVTLIGLGIMWFALLTPSEDGENETAYRESK